MMFSLICVCAKVLSSVDVMSLNAGIAAMVTVIMVFVCVGMDCYKKQQRHKHAEEVQVSLHSVLIG